MCPDSARTELLRRGPSAEVPALSLAPDSTVLLVIDVQLDFVAPEGACARGGADVSDMPAAISRIEDALGAARACGMEVCFVRLETSPGSDSPAMVRHMARRGMAGGEVLCRAGSPGADYWRVRPGPGEREVTKSRYDAFLETGLDALLRRLGARTVVLTGVSTDCCVDATARGAFQRDYDVLVLGDACAAGTRDFHEAALGALSRYAATISDTASFVAACSAALRGRETAGECS